MTAHHIMVHTHYAGHIGAEICKTGAGYEIDIAGADHFYVHSSAYLIQVKSETSKFDNHKNTRKQSITRKHSSIYTSSHGECILNCSSVLFRVFQWQIFVSSPNRTMQLADNFIHLINSQLSNRSDCMRLIEIVRQCMTSE